MSSVIFQRIAQLPVLPELRAALEKLVEQDWGIEAPASQERDTLQAALMLIYRELGGGDSVHVQPLLLAWYTLRGAIFRLDHLQDNDPDLDVSFGTATSIGQRYNLVLTYYLLATAVLDDLNAHYVPYARVRRLMRLWNDSLLRAGSGQQRDLTTTHWSNQQPQAALEHYEHAMRAKAGSIYSLGFGGVATLATDDESTIQVLSLVGELYGTLLQFDDDLLDAAIQAKSVLTLPQVYQSAQMASGVPLPPHTVHHYARFIRHAYFEHVKTIIEPLPEASREAIVSIFRQSFPLINTGNDQQSSVGNPN